MSSTDRTGIDIYLRELLSCCGMRATSWVKDLCGVGDLDSQLFLAIYVPNWELRKHSGVFVCRRREAAKTQSLSHKKNLKVLDCDKEGDFSFVTMELMKHREFGSFFWAYIEELYKNLAWHFYSQVMVLDAEDGTV